MNRKCFQKKQGTLNFTYKRHPHSIHVDNLVTTGFLYITVGVYIKI